MRPITCNQTMLRVCEIFSSIQGESTFAGRLCTFVRLSGCNLRCTWCDTAYSREEAGREMSIEQILSEVGTYEVDLVEITGGEPLLQPETPRLCERLLQKGYEVLVETNGTQDIGLLPSGVRRIIDVKCPGSGAADSFLTSNIEKIGSGDEVKFVLSSLDDARWAEDFITGNELGKRCTVIFSPVVGMLEPGLLADWMVKERVEARLGLQLHKLIWGDARGV
ncbi:MAG: 7-carboxy-7-deazaguanine synthase QueE [Chitinispirillaceae bacterium]